MTSNRMLVGKTADARLHINNHQVRDAIDGNQVIHTHNEPVRAPGTS